MEEIGLKKAILDGNYKVKNRDTAKTAEEKGEAIIFKNNKPKYLVIDIEKNGSLLELSEDEKIDIVARRILEKYLPAFKELAK